LHFHRVEPLERGAFYEIAIPQDAWKIVGAGQNTAKFPKSSQPEIAPAFPAYRPSMAINETGGH